jgi:hypothetical protein
LERKRERAIELLLEQGRTQSEVAHALRVDPRSVRRWWRAARSGGKAALQAVPARGRPPKMTSEQRQQLEQDAIRISALVPSPFFSLPQPRNGRLRRSVVRMVVSMAWGSNSPGFGNGCRAQGDGSSAQT